MAESVCEDGHIYACSVPKRRAIRGLNVHWQSIKVGSPQLQAQNIMGFVYKMIQVVLTFGMTIAAENSHPSFRAARGRVGKKESYA
jgi:hypothetical protein